MKEEELNKEKLIKFFMRSLFVIPHQYQSQDPNRLTLLYFTISGLDILGALDKVENKERIIDWIYSLQVLPSASQTGAIRVYQFHFHLLFPSVYCYHLFADLFATFLAISSTNPIFGRTDPLVAFYWA